MEDKWSSRMIQAADSIEMENCVVHCPSPVNSGSLDTSSVPHSKDVVISIIFVYISVLISKNYIHFILLKQFLKHETVPRRSERSTKLYASIMTFGAYFN